MFIIVAVMPLNEGNILTIAAPSRPRVGIIVSIDRSFTINKIVTNKIIIIPRSSKNRRGN